jgi:hypothetical protein
MLLNALTSVVLFFAQAAPGAATPPAADPPHEAARISRVVVTSGSPETPLTSTAEVKDKTVSPLVVTPRQQRELQDEIAKRQLICHTEPVIGSLFPKKICATKEELADRTATDQAEVRKAQALRPYQSN